MSDWNDLEKQLRSWTPRRPSKGLEARIFSTAGAGTPEVAMAPIRLNWLAPAMAALMLMGVMFNQRFGGSMLPASGSRPMAAMILSNQNVAAYLPGSFQGDRNTLPADAFDWANANAATSSVPAPAFSRLTN